MVEKSPPPSDATQALADHIGKKALRKLRARRWSKTNSVWFGLGMMGLVGWSVVVPTLLGGALGVWIDRHYHGSHRLTLPLLMVGLALGCINAWHWVAKEDAAMGRDGVDDGTGGGGSADDTISGDTVVSDDSTKDSGGHRE